MCVLKNDIADRLANGWPVDEVIREIESAGFTTTQADYLINEVQVNLDKRTSSAPDEEEIKQLGGI